MGLLGEDHIKTPGGKYRYPESEIKRLLGEKAPKGRVAIYARVRRKQRLIELRARVISLNGVQANEMLRMRIGRR